MELVLASVEELNSVKEMYTKIVENMYDNNIKIWNEFYPNEMFESDIEQQNLYILKNNDEILGAFTIYEYDNSIDDVDWKHTESKSYLLNRLGVNVKYLHKGIGKKLIEEACSISRKKGAKCLRLLVSTINGPAINLYVNYGFKKVNGIHKEIINDDFSLDEYGFELLL